MKPLLLIISLLLGSSTFCYSQKCNVSEDAFSGAKVVEFSNPRKDFEYELRGDSVRLTLRFRQGGELNTIMPAGTPFSLKLEDGSILKLATAFDTRPNTQIVAGNGSAAALTWYRYVFLLSPAELDKLSASKATHMRHPNVDNGTQDWDLGSNGATKKYAKLLKAGAECMKEHYKGPANK